MLIAIITIMILAMSHMISYPDKIVATGVVTTERPPIALIATSSDRIAQVIVASGTPVEIGDDLIYLHNAADKGHILSLIDWVEKRKHRISPNMPAPAIDLNVGPMQTAYAQLLLKLSEYRQIHNQTIIGEQINTLEHEKARVAELNNSISAEQIHYTSEFLLTKKELDRAALLHTDGLISTQQLEIAEAKYNNFQRQEESMTKALIQNAIRSDQLTIEQQKLEEGRIIQLRQYQFAIQEIITNITSLYHQWSTKYHIQADIPGTVQYSYDVAEGYQMNPGMQLGHIIPVEENNNTYIKVRAPSTGIAKLKKSNRAVIRFDAYPAKEYGLLEATTDDISIIPYADKEGVQSYQIKIKITLPITTTYNKTIAYRPNLAVQVDLITEDQSILDRIFSQIRDLIKNK